MTQLYTPFMAQSGKTIGDAYTRKTQNKLYSDAYMDKPGAMQQLMQVSPQMANQLQMQKQQAQQLKLQQSAKQEAGMRKLFTDNKKIIDEVVENVANFDKFEEAKGYFDRKKEEYRPIFGEALNNIQLTEQMFNESKAVHGEKPKSPTGFQGLIKAYQDAPEGSEEKKLLEAKIQKETAQSGGISIDKDGNIQIGGPTKLQKPNLRESEERIISGGESLARMSRIKQNYDPSFLTLQGKAKKAITAGKSFLDMDISAEDKASIQQHRKFSQSVNFEFNAYRKLITGAAAAASELKDLKKATISTDISPVEFEAAFNEYSTELARTIRIRNKVLRGGLEVGSKQFGEELDRLYISGADDSMDARGDELEAQGMAPAKIVSTLEAEGYF
jgi:hypothetical protein